MSTRSTNSLPPPVNGLMQFTLDLAEVAEPLTVEQVTHLAANAIQAIKSLEAYPPRGRLTVSIFGQVSTHSDEDPIPWDSALVLRSVRARFAGLPRT
jgi:hypothetical protein